MDAAASPRRGIILRKNQHSATSRIVIALHSVNTGLARRKFPARVLGRNTCSMARKRRITTPSKGISSYTHGLSFLMKSPIPAVFQRAGAVLRYLLMFSRFWMENSNPWGKIFSFGRFILNV